MATTATIDLRHVARGLGISAAQVQAVVELLDDGNTVPFITRYRKDQTGGLDEEQVRQVQARLTKMRQLAERKQTILRSIEAQGKLTEELAKQIHAATTTKRLEDLYLPYKPKKQTLATAARERGLEPLAREILEAAACADLDARAADFVNTDRKVPTPAEALLGAGHILAEQFSERADLRGQLREVFQRTGKFVSKRIAAEPETFQEVDKPAEPVTVPSEASESPSAEPQTPSTDSVAPDATTGATDSNADATDQPPATPDNPAEKPAEAADVQQQPSEVTSADTPTAETGDTDTPSPEAPSPEAPSPEAPATAEQSKPAETDEVASPSPTTEPKPTEAATTKQPAVAKQPAAKKKVAMTKKEERAAQRKLKKQKAEEKKIKAYSDYFDYSEEVKKIPVHRVLAMNRGERAKVLRVKIEVDLDAVEKVVEELLVPGDHPHADYLRGCARDALTRLILPSLERDIRRELTDRAELHAVKVFARNLRNLLLQPPVRDRRVLAVDPGYKSGCKLVALDQFGNVLDHGVIYLVGRAERRKRAKEKVVELIRRFQIGVAVIGNGTACRDCENFFCELIENELKDDGVAYVIVNEAGASVYSTNAIGREEFPNYDATLRGAISIGRRLQDPLSELVKIDPANIGVGMYQHDVRAKHLRVSLDEVVESCVNYVAVDVNSASPSLLRYVSGLNQLTARRIYEHRTENGPFRNREQLKDVAGFGAATFVQSAGFLKIRGGDSPLDGTWIHPESYETATQVLAKLGHSPADLAGKESAAQLGQDAAKVDVEEMAKELGVGTLTLKDILAQLARPGRDPREDLPKPVFKQGVMKLEDLSPGMELTGTVLNVVDFGAFVDIGMHDSGLVHVSRLADRFIQDPHEAVAVGNIVKVWVVEVDKERRRVSLTMIQPGTERPRPARGRGKPQEGKPQEGKPREGKSTEHKPAGGKPRTDAGPQAGRSRDSQQSKQKGPPRTSDGRGKDSRSRDGRSRDGRGRGRDRRPAKIEYRPKVQPKPIVPLTEDMKKGNESMRTFGDLAQFFDLKQGTESGRKPDDQAKAKKKKPPKKKDELPKQDQPQETGEAVESTVIETAAIESTIVDSTIVETNVVETAGVETPQSPILSQGDTVETPADTPDVLTPEVQTPDVQTPDVQTPEVQTPEVQTPDATPAEEPPVEKLPVKSQDPKPEDEPHD
ncbi:MAG: Tex-like N-terminal domain-containing protein [Thermoguttaceae bacterium]